MCHSALILAVALLAHSMVLTSQHAHASMAFVRLRGEGAGISVGEALIEVEGPTPTTTLIPPRHPFSKLR